MFSLNPKKINYDEELGRGQFGAVYPYQKDPADKKWVVKVTMTNQVKEFYGCINEIVLGFNCDHQNVLPVRGYCIDFQAQKRNWEIYIKLPRMKCSLQNILDTHKKSKEPIPEDKIVQYLYATTKGLRYLHGKNIAHRDIKPGNILLDENDTLKVADFGLGNFIEGEASYVAEKAGALFYAAPENLDKSVSIQKRDLFKTDFWSLGMFLLELCNLDLRFLDFNSSGAQKQADVAKLVRGLRGKYSDALLDLILGLVRSKPSERRDLRYVQEVIEANYSEMIQMDKQTKRVQVKIDSPESSYIGEEEFLNIPEPLDISLKELLGSKLIQDEKNDFEENKRNISPSKSTKTTVQAFTNAIRQKWTDFYEITNENDQGISVESIGPKQITEIEINRLLGDLSEICDRTKYEELEGLNLDFRSKVINDKIVQDVAFYISMVFKNLKYLLLTFHSSDMNNDGKALYHRLKSSGRRVNAVEVRSAKITDQGVKTAISQICSNLQNLQGLSINFNSDKITDHGVKEATYLISINLKNLQQLSVYFWGGGVTDAGVRDATSQIARNLGNLQQLAVGFNSNTISDQALKDATFQIAHIQGLQDLSIDFISPKITDYGIEAATYQICNNLHNLEKLWVYFLSRKITDQGLKDSTHQLSSLENLQQLSVLFDGDIITDQGVKHVTSQISLKLKHLQQLSVAFMSTSGSITNQGVKEAASQIALNLKDLQQLSFYFLSKKITDQGVKDLTSEVCLNLKNLQQLAIHFISSGITDQGVKDAVSQICLHQKNLQELALYFVSPKITNNKMKEAASEILLNLKNLHFFSLNEKTITNFSWFVSSYLLS